ncbi:MAG: zinc ribbon domain-containing protein [Oscillospiraceae bacterium]|nr:zinc ribbon domain-containing protein [Oscillospiraceae bacterium]
MGSFDRLFNKAVDVANTAGKKTGEVIEASKIRVRAANLENDIQKLMAKLGNIVYEGKKNGTENDDLVERYVNEIDELRKQLSELNAQIDDIHQVRKCTNCGASNGEENIFCQRCGAKLG